MEKIAKPVKEKIDNTALVEDFRAEGGQITHIHVRNPKARSMSLAFKDLGSRIELATSVTHRNDTFTKKIGTKVALEHFSSGKTVFIPRSSFHKTALTQLQSMFDVTTW